MKNIFLPAALLLKVFLCPAQDVVFNVKHTAKASPQPVYGIIEYQSGIRTAAPGQDRIEHYRLVMLGPRKIFEEQRPEANGTKGKLAVNDALYQPTRFGTFDFKVQNDIYTIVAGDTNQAKTEIPLFSLIADSAYCKAGNWFWRLLGYNNNRNTDTARCVDTAAVWNVNGKDITCYKIVAHGFARGDINGNQETTTYIDKAHYLPVAIIIEFDPRGVEQPIKLTPQQEKLWMRRTVTEVKAVSWME